MLDLPHIVPEYENSNCSACRLDCGSWLQLAGHGHKKILIVFDAQDAIQQTTKRTFAEVVTLTFVICCTSTALRRMTYG